LWNTQVQQYLTHSCVDGMRRCGLFTVTPILPPSSFVTVTITYMVFQAATSRMGDMHLKVAAA